MRPRSPRPPAESARALVVVLAVLSSGCEAAFGPPALDEGADEIGGEQIDSLGPEAATTTGVDEPEPKDASEVDGGEVGGAEVDGGETDGNRGDGGVAFDLGGAETGEGGRDDGRAPPPVNDGDCCEVAMGIGCADDGVEACVCAVDPYCCETAWDELCVNHVEDALCGGCTFGPSSTDFGIDCCEPSDMPGCPDETASECVCDADAFCCLVEWDQVCIDTGIALGCLSCGGGTTGDEEGTSSDGGGTSTGTTSN